VSVTENSVIPTPKTIFQEVHKLPPGYMLSCRKGDVTVAPYWDINFLHPVRSTEPELADRLKVFFEDAVATRYHTDGDSPRVGTFLSGGVDSSTITGVLTQVAGRPITSVSIGFDEQRFNEINYARIAAQAFGSKHVEYFVTPTDTFDALPMVVDAFDEPFANASAIPTYYCAKVAKEHGVDAMYAGDGGDELFAGNERYATERLFEYYRRIPAWLREPLIRPLVFALANGLKQDLFVKGKKYILRACIPFPQRLYSYELFSVVPMEFMLDDRLLAAAGRDYNPNEHIDRHYGLAPARTELDREMYVDLKVAIADNDLFKVTRMTEAAGVTVRFPFLDHPLAEFAAAVPAAIRMRGRHLRSFFKKAYADMLPSAIRTKTKHGFGLPIPVWLRTDKRLNDMMHDLVLSPRSVQRGYFRKAALEDLIERHKGDETSFYGGVLWNLMVLELWHRRRSL
jgi:asparagine synthase (glutamine-hydrolysing)